jgi:hypothetical protein
MTPRRETSAWHRRVAVAAVLALALCTVLAMTFGGAADAKTKKKAKKSPTVFQQVLSANAPIPDAPAAGPSTPLDSTIIVGKKFKGKVVADVNVTSIQTTGSAAGAAQDLVMRITAPNGHSVRLWSGGFGDQSIGPLTLDDDTPVSICNDPTPPCSWPVDTLNPPFAGTSNLQFLGAGGTGPLSNLDGVPMRGTWTFQIWDDGQIGKTSTLNTWGLKVTAARPVT